MSYNFEKWMENDIRNRPRNRWNRWAIAGGIGSAIVAGIVSPFLDPESRWPGLFMMWSVVFVTMGLYHSPFSRDMWLRKTKPGYDEFELSALANATQKSYGILLLSILTLTAWCYFGSSQGWTYPASKQDWWILGVVFLNIGIGLPILIVEFTVPMPSPNDLTEEAN